MIAISLVKAELQNKPLVEEGLREVDVGRILLPVIRLWVYFPAFYTELGVVLQIGLIIGQVPIIDDFRLWTRHLRWLVKNETIPGCGSG